MAVCPAQHPHRGHLRPPSGPFGTLWPHPKGGIWQKAMHRPIGEGPLGKDIAGTPCPTRPSPSPAAPPPAPWQPWPLLWSYLLFALLSCPTPAALNSLPRCWAFLPSNDLDLLQSLFPRRHPTSALSRLLLPRHQLKKPRSLHLTVTPRRVKGMGPRPTPAGQDGQACGSSGGRCSSRPGAHPSPLSSAPGATCQLDPSIGGPKGPSQLRKLPVASLFSPREHITLHLTLPTKPTVTVLRHHTGRTRRQGSLLGFCWLSSLRPNTAPGTRQMAL